MGFICDETGTSTKYLSNGKEDYAAEHAYGVTPDRLHGHGTWQDPLTIFLAVAGVGAGAGIVLRR